MERGDQSNKKYIFVFVEGPFFWREQDGNLQPVILSIKNRKPPILTWATKHFYQTDLTGVKNVSMAKNKGEQGLNVSFTSPRN